ncbi:MAG: hypothetical protein WA796_26385, partial [Pseudolabrys sp.]
MPDAEAVERGKELIRRDWHPGDNPGSGVLVSQRTKEVLLEIAAVSFDARGARATEGPGAQTSISAPATFTRIASITRSRP